MHVYKPNNSKTPNQVLVTELFKRNGSPMMKRQLSEYSNLSVIIINKLISEMFQQNIIVEIDAPIETGGHHAIAYQFNERRNLIWINPFIEQEKRWHATSFLRCRIV